MDYKNDIGYRKETLKKLLYNIQKSEDLIVKALYDDFKKPEFEAVLTETNYVISDLKDTIKNICLLILAILSTPTIIGLVTKDKPVFNAELEGYRAHHQPNEGWYYAIHSIANEPVSGKKFVIGTNVQSKASGSTVELNSNGPIVEIEVPTREAGIKEGAGFVTVKIVDGVPTTIYLKDREAVLSHNLNT